MKRIDFTNPYDERVKNVTLKIKLCVDAYMDKGDKASVRKVAAEVNMPRETVRRYTTEYLGRMSSDGIEFPEYRYDGEGFTYSVSDYKQMINRVSKKNKVN